LLALAQDQIKLEPKWTKGEKSKYAFQFDMVLPDAEVRVKGGIASEIKDTSKLTYTFQDVSVVAADQTIEAPYEPALIVLDSAGFVKEFEGGITGGDNVRMFLALHFIPPSKELAKGETWKHTFPKNTGLSLEAMNYEAKYIGPEKIGDTEAFKFETKLTETDSGAFTVENTFFVDKAGKVVKLEGKFKNMPVPAAQQSSDGKVSFSLSK